MLTVFHVLTIGASVDIQFSYGIITAPCKSETSLGIAGYSVRNTAPTDESRNIADGTGGFVFMCYNSSYLTCKYRRDCNKKYDTCKNNFSHHLIHNQIIHIQNIQTEIVLNCIPAPLNPAVAPKG